MFRQAPVNSNRLAALDAARALAITIMVVINFRMTSDQSPIAPLWLEDLINFLCGRAAALFVILAGFSLFRMGLTDNTDPHTRKTSRQRLLIRSLLLWIVGIDLHSWWDADILHFYAIFISVGMMFLGLSGRWFRVVMAVVGIASFLASFYFSYQYNYMDTAFSDGGTFLSLLIDIFTSRYYPFLPWFGFFMMGMWLARSDLLSRIQYRRLAWTGLGLCVGAEVFESVAQWLFLKVGLEHELVLALIDCDSFPVTPLFIVSAGGGAFAVIGFLRGYFAFSGKSQVSLAWCAMGRYTLTIYLSHLYVARVLYQGGLKAVAPLSIVTLQAFGFCAAALLASYLWQRYHRYGPIEALFRVIINHPRITAVVRTSLPAPADPDCMSS